MTSPVSIDAARCSGCGTCVAVCPTDVFRMKPETARAFVAYPSDCHVCFLCVEDCPEHAIAVDHSLAGGRMHSAYDGLDPSRLVLPGAPRATS